LARDLAARSALPRHPRPEVSSRPRSPKAHAVPFGRGLTLQAATAIARLAPPSGASRPSEVPMQACRPARGRAGSPAAPSGRAGGCDVGRGAGTRMQPATHARGGPAFEPPAGPRRVVVSINTRVNQHAYPGTRVHGTLARPAPRVPARARPRRAPARSPPLVAPVWVRDAACDDTKDHGCLTPRTSLDAKGASSIHAGTAENDDRTHALRRPHLTLMPCVDLTVRLRLCTSQLSFHACRAYAGCLCTRCHGCKAARLGARQTLHSSVCTLLHPCGCGEELA